MTTNPTVKPALLVHLSTKDRHVILDNVLKAVRKRFYSPEKLNEDWRTAVECHRPLIEEAATAESFEQAISDLLAELHTSHLGFFHRSARRASSRAALSATYLPMTRAMESAGFFRMFIPAGPPALPGSHRATFCSASIVGRSLPLSIPSSSWASRPALRLSATTSNDAPCWSMWPGPKARSSTLFNQRSLRPATWTVDWGI